MKKKTENKPEVMIIWASTKEHLDKGEIHVLDSYVGPRKYIKDQLDPRLTMGSDQKLPYAKTWQEAVFLSFLDGNVSPFTPLLQDLRTGKN